MASDRRRCSCICRNKKCVLVSTLMVLVAALLLQWSSEMDIESGYYRGKRVVITGASRGIGRGLALRLAQLGARLVITARTESDLKAVEKECRRRSGGGGVEAEVVSVVGSVGEEEDCGRVAEATLAAYGGVDILILNAAYSPSPTLFMDTKEPAESFLNVFKVNTLQSVYLISMFKEELERSSAIVVGVSSVAGSVGLPKLTAYSSSKHAINGFYSSLHRELAIANSNISAMVMPLPFVRTDKAVHTTKPYSETYGLTVQECAELMLKAIPLKRSMYHITWDTFLLCHLSSLCPELMNWIVHLVMNMLFENA